jgi:thiosulfate dehydrogenase (quinone) large subunit
VSDYLDSSGLEAPPRPARERPGRKRSGISPAVALLPLRLFLGITFVYAGIQKLSDPGFLHAGAPTYIGTQLTGFANHTPGGFILRTFAIPHAELAGVGVAIAEILIGLLVTLGLFTRLAAACGLGLNLLLFLTASWHTSPYFLGPDIVFTFAWLPFVLTGASGQPALDNAVLKPSDALVRRTQLRTSTQGAAAAPGSALTRRVLLAQVATGALALSGIAALLKGRYSGPTLSASANSPISTGASHQASGSGGQGSTGAKDAALPSNAVKLGPSSRLPTGQAAEYPDPSDGSADILIRESDGSLRAFSAICTHAGCTVSFQGGEIVCPCHGGVFSAQTGEVVSGPPPTGLAAKKVLEHGGQIYAVPS